MTKRRAVKASVQRGAEHTGVTLHPQSGQPDAAPAQSPMLSLQRTIGNRATLSLLSAPRLQRMPTRERVVGILGKPHSNFLWVKQSTKYKAVLDKLDAFHTYTQNTSPGNTQGEVMGKLTDVMEKYNAIIDACDAYQGETGDKAEYFMRMKVQTQNEKTSAIGAMVSYAGRVGNLPSFTRAGNKISSVLTTSGPDNLDLDEGTHIKNVGGGINQLGVFNHGGKEQFFKANRNDATGPTQEIDNRVLKAYESGNQQELQEAAKEQGAMVTLNAVTETAGISQTEAKLANRDVAMYRLDQLLGANLIARTQFALRNMPEGPQLGSLMEGAKGTKGGEMGDNLVKDSNAQRQKPGSVNVQDPNLQRLLSRLQLLDTLAYQVDRNAGNFYVQFDRNGNVTGVTGIDNDMSFGTKTGIRDRAQELPGLAKFVDKEMAEKIISLDPRLLMLSLSDLLSPAELTALNERLTKLKMALVQMQSANKLLTPNQWDQLTAKSQIDEKDPNGKPEDRTTYYGQMGKHVN